MRVKLILGGDSVKVRCLFFIVLVFCLTSPAFAAAGEDAASIESQVPADEEAQRFQISGAVRFGLLHDSNVSQGPFFDSTRLGDWDVRLRDGKERSSAGTYLGTNLNMGYRMDTASPWWWVGDVDGLWRVNANSSLKDTNSRSLHWGRVGAGLRYMGDGNQVDARLKAEILDYEFDSNVTALGAELRYTHFLTPSAHLIADGAVESRSYNRDGERDGTFSRIGGYTRYLFGDAGHEFLIGLGFMGATADVDNYAYDGWQAMSRAVFKLPHGFTLSPHVSYTRESYDGPATTQEICNRRDNRLRIGADVAYAINESWSVEAGYDFTNINSNSSLYDYDRHMLTLGLVWRF